MITIENPFPAFAEAPAGSGSRNECARRVRAAMAASGAGSGELCSLMGWPHRNRLRRIANGSRPPTIACLLQIACATGFDIRRFYPGTAMPEVPEHEPCATRIPRDAAAELVSSSIASAMGALGTDRANLDRSLGWADHTRLGRYLSGQRMPDADALDEIARALGCRTWELLPTHDEVVSRCGCDRHGEASTAIVAVPAADAPNRAPARTR